MFFRNSASLRRVFSLPVLESLDRNGLRFLKMLPAFSSLFIASLGAFFLVNTLLTGGTEVAAILRFTAEWLEAR